MASFLKPAAAIEVSQEPLSGKTQPTIILSHAYWQRRFGGNPSSMIGICVGLVVALGLGAVLSAVLYEVRSVDVPVLSGVTVLLLAVSGLACYVPARKATRVDPLVALRCE
jgi:hypothetical protein